MLPTEINVASKMSSTGQSLIKKIIFKGRCVLVYNCFEILSGYNKKNIPNKIEYF